SPGEGAGAGGGAGDTVPAPEGGVPAFAVPEGTVAEGGLAAPARTSWCSVVCSIGATFPLDWAHRVRPRRAIRRNHRLPAGSDETAASAPASLVYRAGVAVSRTVEADLRRILAVQALRAFAYGFGIVVLATALSRSGLSDVAVTIVFTSMLAGMAIASIGVGLVGDRVGRRRLYAGLLALMGAVGIVFAFAGSVWVLSLAALTGTMSTDANESGPITSLVQEMIGQAPATALVSVFGRYNAIAYLACAIGSCADGLPVIQYLTWPVVHTIQ